MPIFSGPGEAERDLEATLAAMKRPEHPILVWQKPRQLPPDGPWEVKVGGDVDTLPLARLIEFYREAEKAKSVTWGYEAGVRAIIYSYATEAEAEGAIRRLKGVIGT